MPPDTTQAQPLSTLLWQHFWWHLRVGTGIWAVTILPLFLSNFPFPPLGSNISNAFNTVMYDYVPMVAMLLTLCLFFALVSGLVRHPLLAFLSRRARTGSGLVWQSLLLFELSVAVLAFIPWPVAYNLFSLEMVKNQFLGSGVLSLPWLLATGLASRRLAAALARHPGLK